LKLNPKTRQQEFDYTNLIPAWEPISCLVISPDNKFLYVGLGKGNLLTLNIDTNTLHRQMQKLDNFDQIKCMAVTPDSKWLFVGDALGLVRQFTLPDVEPFNSFTFNSFTIFWNNQIEAILITSDSRYVFCHTDNGHINQIDIRESRVVKFWLSSGPSYDHQRRGLKLQISPDNRFLLETDRSGNTNTWSVR
jgi:WD40 repeat protein